MHIGSLYLTMITFETTRLKLPYKSKTTMTIAFRLSVAPLISESVRCFVTFILIWLNNLNITLLLQRSKDLKLLVTFMCAFF